MRESKLAFTLIELLVVVAVIAILAAIAVPNFLEAQTRSKVSRAKADIRTVVTAVEAYRVDANGYPTYHYTNVTNAALYPHVGGRVLSWGIPDPAWDGRNPITTPIQYISTMPADPFARRLPGPDEAREYLYTNWTYAIAVPGLIPGFATAFDQARSHYGEYRLNSRGPDADETLDARTAYDPTNGTTSEGDIAYGPRTGFDVNYAP